MCTRRLWAALLLLLLLSADPASAARHTTADRTGLPRRSVALGRRQLLQYTGAVVAGSTPSCCCCCCPGSTPCTTSDCFKSTAYAPNPAVGEVNKAMATGQAPSDIASVKAKGFVRGKFMGTRIDAQGQACACCGTTSCGGITACGSAEGCCSFCGPCGRFDAQGQARAAAATARAGTAAGGEVLCGAAAAEASGCCAYCCPDGSTVAAQGSAGAHAEGWVVRTPPRSMPQAKP